MELIVELISRSKKVISSQRIEGPEASIGRAYNNDVVLADPYVCANHLSLTASESGIWQVCDKDSVNGSFSDVQKQLNGCQSIHSGDIISVGKSHLRFIYPNQPVAPTIRLSGIEGFLNYISSPLILTLVFLVYISLLMGNHYMQSVVELKTSVALKNIFTLLMVSSLWPMLCALLARLFKNDARILTQLAVCYTAFIIFLLLGWLDSLISFNSSGGWFSSGFSFISEAGLLFALFWANFYIAFHTNHTRRTIIAGGFTLVLLLLSFLYNNASIRDFNPRPSYDSTLLAPEFAIASPISANEFIANSADIFDRTEKKAQEKDEE
ncbi:MAG: hypothetical protein ACI8WB_004842 [Phenylobacterium sp.]|jgi:hypothetical protein